MDTDTRDNLLKVSGQPAPRQYDALQGMEYAESTDMAKPLRAFTARLILEAAIAFEEQSYRYYQSALGQSVMSDTFDLLKKLLGEELRHRIALEEAQRSGVPERQSGGGETRSNSEPVPSAAFREVCEEWPPLLPADSKREILERAMQREQCAYRFYRDMARGTFAKGLRGLFDALAEDERRHLELIREEMEQLEA